MPVFDQATDERLSQVAAHLQQAFSLIAAVDPGIVERLIPGTIIPTIQRSLSLERPNTSSGNGSVCHSIIDDATFSVRWADRICRLGNTVSFRLLEQLARRPNQFISYDVLLDAEKLWDRQTSYEAVRSAVKIIRRKLIAAGMEDLAEAIDGSASHHYALNLPER